jgi:hypothetical protein
VSRADVERSDRSIDVYSRASSERAEARIVGRSPPIASASGAADFAERRGLSVDVERRRRSHRKQTRARLMAHAGRPRRWKADDGPSANWRDVWGPAGRSWQAFASVT